ncbi:MAG: hypothetical protein IT260_24065, partial [Saprospiraceae bacterium]|nr:hypothetical protein [Saprospiraceae bacterium]
GALLDTFNLNTLLGVQENLEGKLLFSTADGGAVVVVQRYLLNAWTYWVAKIGATGNLAWKKTLPFLADAYPAGFSDGQELPDGSLVLFGHQDNLFLIKLSGEGVIHPHTLIGRVQRDSTFNCLPDAFDPPLEGWVVSARSTTDSLVYFGNSDADGNYILSDLDSGAYQVVLTPESYLWQPCADTVALQFNGLAVQTDTLDFQVQSLYDCPLMQVDVATPFLRRCMENTYSVQYCNVGNQPANGASITLLLDPLLQVNSSTLPYVQNGAELTFALGQVAAGACNSFQLVTTTSCDAELGQSLCVEAHIYPDTLCASNLPNWSGAQVEVTAHCEGDSVLFRLHNTGTMPMSEALDFIIVDDHVITRQGMFQLNPGAVLEERVRADGSTWRLIAEQEPGFPLSPDRPTAGVEACQPLPGGPVSLGMLNLFANYSGNPFHATDCHPVIGSWDPNDKQAFPQGAEQQHFIDQNQSIQYLIRFQNTGTDTAFTVVLRDTLSNWLHAASIRPGAASHPYTWTLSGQGILTVVFADILLPDSNVNEVASHGFIQFNIEQQRDVPLGARIENRAGIYFDFNAPVLTNTVFHTVGKNFLPTSTGGPTPPPSPLEIWPNPSVDRILVRLGNLYEPGQHLVLRNTLGRQILQLPVQGPQQELLRQALPAGWYWLELRDARRVRAGGKLIWMD